MPDIENPGGALVNALGGTGTRSYGGEGTPPTAPPDGTAWRIRDTWIDTTTGQVYEYSGTGEFNGLFPSINIKGPQGNQGETGAAGASITGPQGEPGANATNAQVANAVSEYLAANSPNATDAQVAAAVAAYIAAHPPANGTNGQNATDNQVAAAVAAYFAAHPVSNGADGVAATIAVGSITTGDAGTAAAVTNSGTASTAIFDFSIPRGNVGQAGSNGANGSAATISVGTVTALSAGATPTVANAGTSGAAVLNFGIPVGAQGIQGTQGNVGNAGAAATVVVGDVSTGAAGSSASVTNSGSSNAATLNFTIPRGDVGIQGIQGDKGAMGNTGNSGSLTVGTVTTGAAGSSAAVANVGTASAAILNFTIPRGDAGATGSAGATGATGAAGTNAAQPTIQNASISGSYTIVPAPGVSPTRTFTYITSSAANAAVTIGETGIAQGSELYIINVGTTNSIIVSDAAGVSESSGNFTVGPTDSIHYIYGTDRWFETGRSNN